MRSSEPIQFLPIRKANTSTAAVVGQSKLIAALDALSLESKPEDDSEVEIISIGPVPIKPKGTGTKARGRKVISTEPECDHPFFKNAKTTTPKPTSIATKSKSGNKAADTQQNLEDAAPARKTSVRRTIMDASSVPSATVTREARTEVHPPYSYKDYTPSPTVVYTRHEEEANELIPSLKKGPLGFDMEWRVLWNRQSNKRKDRRVGVVQLADTAGLILIIQVYGMSRFPKKLQELIEDPTVPKLGANILNDGGKLLNDYGILGKNFVELARVVHVADVVGHAYLTAGRSPAWKFIIALPKLVAQYCRKTLLKPKSIQMGNWEAELDQARLEYAASDAHCAVKIYERLCEIAEENGIALTDNVIRIRCSASVRSPCAESPPQGISKLPSCSNVSKEEESSKPGQLRRHATMPNVPVIPPQSNNNTRPPHMRPQYLRAYKLWHEQEMSLEKMCIELKLPTKETELVEAPTAQQRPNNGISESEECDKVVAESNALKPNTVISYIIGALQADSKLPFSMDKLRELVQMEAGSWERHREWLLRAWRSRVLSGVSDINGLTAATYTQLCDI